VLIKLKNHLTSPQITSNTLPNMKKPFLFIALVIVLTANAQDSLKIMQYNLLNFGNITDYCTVSNNNPVSKTAWLKTLIDYYLPDVFTVNEISSNSYYHQLILDAVLNTSGRLNYQKAVATNHTNSDIVNMLYYNSAKIGLASQDVILNSLRDINVYKLFYREEFPGNSLDTIFFYCIVAHLKAGTTNSDRTERGEMAALIMNYLSSKNITAPSLIMGDMNLQNSSEPAWVSFTNFSNPVYNFTDPAGKVGSWHANAAYVSVHTQSTHVTSNGCPATGGMDDRFDFILTNQEITNASSKVKYIQNSFLIPGQDGLRFNGSVIDPPNNSAPPAIINALYEMSDHLPVIIKLQVEAIQVPVLDCAELLFSEYVEGTGNNKALEIFNPTENPINLSAYRLARYVNGSTNPDLIGLSGSLAPKKTYVVVLDKRDPNGTGTETPVDSSLIAVADTFLCPDQNLNQTMYFNGNDAMSLQKSNGQIVDLIGKIGENPGVGWTDDSLCTAGPFTDKCSAIAWTLNHTMIRKHQVGSGITLNPAYFDVTLEWDTLPVNTFTNLGFHESDCNGELPDNWHFTETMISHIITIPLETIPVLNNVLLKSGDLIGVFYLDGNLEKCAGYATWTGNSNIAIAAFGDDFLSPEKDGFSENENLIWKVFSISENQDFYVDVDYSLNFPDHDGKFTPFGFSGLTRFDAWNLEQQLIEFQHGWSGISSFLNPKWKDIRKLFGPDTLNIKFLSDGVRIYYPEGNNQTLIDWESNNGYYAKVLTPFQLQVEGIPIKPKYIGLVSGWNLFMVKSPCIVNTADISTELGSSLVQIKEIAGTLIFWPEKNISTLQTLSPGKSYLIMVNQDCTFTFNDCK